MFETHALRAYERGGQLLRLVGGLGWCEVFRGSADLPTVRALEYVTVTEGPQKTLRAVRARREPGRSSVNGSTFYS